MGDHADDARDEEERWQELWWDHKHKKCLGDPDCPFCNPEFVPLFNFQAPRDK